MPWKVADVESHMKGLGPSQSQAWVKMANSSLMNCMKKGGSEESCAGMAIRIANAGVKKVESQDISFSNPLLEATHVDKEKGIYEVTIIKEGLTSDGRRYYPRETLERAVPLFEGIQAFADHPTKSEMKDRPERSIRDLIGMYEAPTLRAAADGTRLRARLKTLESSKWVRPILDMATENPKMAGTSIHADGKVLPKGKGEADLVESIDAVFSTDVVTKPNAGGRIETILASQREEGGEEMKIEELTLEQLKKDRPDLFESAVRQEKETLEAAHKKALEEAKKEKEGDKFVSKEAFESLKESQESLLIEKKITESKILDAVKDKEDQKKVNEFLTASLKGKTEEEQDKIIESQRTFLKGIGAKVQGNGPKEAETKKGYHIGSLLPEAKKAYFELQEVK